MREMGFSDTGRIEVDTTIPFWTEMRFSGGQRLMLPHGEIDGALGGATEGALRVYRRIVIQQPELLDGIASVDLTGVDPNGTGRIVLTRRTAR